MFFEELNRVRKTLGFLTIEQVMLLADRGNLILDPFSTLISHNVELGIKNIICPNVSIINSGSGVIKIINGNTFYSGTRITAENAKITVGSENEIGEGGIAIKAVGQESIIEIGDLGRYNGNAQILGVCSFGDGAQVLGSLKIIDCQLLGGESYRFPDPDMRAGVIKGSGTVSKMKVACGEVVNSLHVVNEHKIERQVFYHPK